jgi:hypothetical protein
MNEKEMNLLESQLRSWRLRRPSPRLSQRLFLSSGAADAGLSVRWLAPAMACLFLALTIVNQEPGLAAGASRAVTVDGILSNSFPHTNILSELYQHPFVLSQENFPRQF